MRTNIYRDKILQVVNKNHLLGISDIQKKITNADYSTIYRNVEQMVSDGVLRKVVVDKNIVLYESIGQGKEHDHFLCVDCGNFESIQPANISSSSLNRHTIYDVLVRGLCEKCNTEN